MPRPRRARFIDAPRRRPGRALAPSPQPPGPRRSARDGAGADRLAPSHRRGGLDRDPRAAGAPPPSPAAVVAGRIRTLATLALAVLVPAGVYAAVLHVQRLDLV